MSPQPWLTYALLSAAAAALVAVLAKVGMKDVDPTLATTVRSVVMTAALLALCAARGLLTGLASLRPLPVTIITLSGLAGAASWLFYFRALQLGHVSQVAPIDKLSMPLAVLLSAILLGDRPSPTNWLGITLIATGAYLAALPAAK